jgi:hypothetical protein
VAEAGVVVLEEGVVGGVLEEVEELLFHMFPQA